jgi:hypothetical protein
MPVQMIGKAKCTDTEAIRWGLDGVKKYYEVLWCGFVE